MEQESETQFSPEQNQNKSNKNIAGIVVLIIVLAAGGYFVYKNKIWRDLRGKQEVVPKNIITPQIARTSPDNLQKELPVNFPKEIPLNGKTKIIESYSANYPNSTAKQSTISFESKNAPKQNYDFYLNWAKDNKWEVINQINEETIKSVYLRKDNKDLNIVINDKITITYMEV